MGILVAHTRQTARGTAYYYHTGRAGLRFWPVLMCIVRFMGNNALRDRKHSRVHLPNAMVNSLEFAVLQRERVLDAHPDAKEATRGHERC